MFVAVLMTIAGLFMYDNAAFFSQVKEERELGYRFEYVGKQPADDYKYSIPVINEQTGEKFIYWEHKIPEDYCTDDGCPEFKELSSKEE